MDCRDVLQYSVPDLEGLECKTVFQRVEDSYKNGGVVLVDSLSLLHHCVAPSARVEVMVLLQSLRRLVEVSALEYGSYCWSNDADLMNRSRVDC